MRNIKAILLLFVVAVVSAATVLYTTVSYAFYDIPIGESIIEISSAESVSQGESQSVPASSETQGLSQTSVPSSSEAAVAAQTEGEVSGAIVSKHIAPSSAPLSYSGVYLKNNSGAVVNIKTELDNGTDIKISKSDEPQVLILHTHATESYMLNERDYYTTTDASRSTDNSINMVAVGEIIATKVKNAGFSVLHDSTLHDYPSYTGSYTASAKTINSYLKKYPSIKIVIDVHRDAVADGSNKVKLVTEVDGKNAAQVMLVMGSETGTVKNFSGWRENLRLAMLFHQKIESMYPGLARPILLMSKKYNQNLTSGSMLIEIGTDANTLTEAKYSAELVGNSLAELLYSLS